MFFSRNEHSEDVALGRCLSDGKMTRQENTSQLQPAPPLAQRNNIYKRRSMPQQRKNKQLDI